VVTLAGPIIVVDDDRCTADLLLFVLTEQVSG
jgi:hypothetical protein